MLMLILLPAQSAILMTTARYTMVTASLIFSLTARGDFLIHMRLSPLLKVHDSKHLVGREKMQCKVCTLFSSAFLGH